MRKIAFFLAVLLSFICSASSVFAETEIILIGSTVDEGGLITVTGRIKEPLQYQRYTVSVVKYNETQGYFYQISDSIYIGTYEATEVTLNDGLFTFSFKGNLVENEKYLIRIGGSNAVMSEKELGVMGADPGPGKDPSDDFILGDVDGNGEIEVSDAVLLLEFVLDRNRIPKEITESENFFERCNVTGDSELTSVQAGCILEKALDETFNFTVKK